MANVNINDGFVRIANSLFEALYRLRVPGRHKDVIACVIRFTYGYQKARDTIAISQIAKATEIDERETRRLLDDLVKSGIVGRESKGRGRPSELWLVKDFEAWKPAKTSNAKRKLAAKDRVQAPGCRPTKPRVQAPRQPRVQAPPSKDIKTRPKTGGLSPPTRHH